MSSARHILGFALAGSALLAVLVGCQPQIGDPCLTAVNCSVRGERRCDLSNRDRAPDDRGECTIENCALGSCPKGRDNSVCIKSYSTEFLSVACDPEREDVSVDGMPPLDDCGISEVCLPEGLCADELTARTSCRRRCDSQNDCRSGYECKRIGGEGVYVAPDPDDPTEFRTTRICVPRE